MMKRIHILGIAGTFMGGLALIAKQMGYAVSGADQNVYPPMSDALKQAGIDYVEGYRAADIPSDVDCVVIGNALSRGNQAVEAVLSRHYRYTSGAQWLADNLLQSKHVLAVAGTHGKTTTSSLLLWLLQSAGLEPGYLIGGVPQNLKRTAHYSESNYFVIEADEYDTAFFDKRSKFIHYHPDTLILNNLEYDHADIFPNLEAIKAQFQFLLRTLPANGTLVLNQTDVALQQVVARGCWTPVVTFAGDGDWQARDINADGSAFTLYYQGQAQGHVQWQLLGMHNVHNALAAIAAATRVGVSFAVCQQALASFAGIKRRLEVISQANGITIYDDFAHHPTAIKTTLAGLRARVADARIIVLLQLGSNSMRAGVHLQALPEALQAADHILLWLPSDSGCDTQVLSQQLGARLHIFAQTDDLLLTLSQITTPGDHVLIMSNKGFDGIYQKLQAGTRV